MLFSEYGNDLSKENKFKKRQLNKQFFAGSFFQFNKPNSAPLASSLFFSEEGKKEPNYLPVWSCYRNVRNILKYEVTC